jgi:hypothetical protein
MLRVLALNNWTHFYQRKKKFAKHNFYLGYAVIHVRLLEAVNMSIGIEIDISLILAG